MIGKVFLFFGVGMFLGQNVARADETQALKAQLVQIIKNNQTEIYTESMREFDNMDTNNNGFVSLDEFIDFQSYGTAEQKTQAFQAMDTNHDKRLTKGELWHFIQKRINAIK